MVSLSISWYLDGRTNHRHVEAIPCGCPASLLRAPIARNESAEVHLLFKDLIQDSVILGSVLAVNLLVGAHDRSSTSVDAVGEWPTLGYN